VVHAGRRRGSATALVAASGLLALAAVALHWRGRRRETAQSG
jgi:hypothetical protein